MRKIGWAIAFSMGLLVGIPYYFWRQATAIPSWYQDRTVATYSIQLNDAAAIQQARQTVAAKMATVQPQPDGTQELRLSEQDINAFAASEINHLAQRTQLTRAVQSVNSTIRDGRIESGAIVNLANVPTHTLSASEQELMVALKQTFPALLDREVYVGIEGTPTVVDGQLQFGQSLRVKVGNLSLSVKDVAQKLNISETRLWEELNRELAALQVKEVEVSGDQLRLRGAP